VKHGDLIAKEPAESAHSLRCQSDLGNQHDCSASGAEHLSHGFQIDECLSTACYAEEQRSAFRTDRIDGIQSRALIRRQLCWRQRSG
jgi:hypothetical protein